MRNLIPQAGGRFIDPIDMRPSSGASLFLGDKIAGEIFGKDAGRSARPSCSGARRSSWSACCRRRCRTRATTAATRAARYMPGTTFRALTGAKYVEQHHLPAGLGVAVEGGDGERPRDPGARSCASTRRTRRRCRSGTRREQFKFLDIFFLAFRLFLGDRRLLTLVVGGIGVSNIMNVVVEERTKEIGIKMALGARQRWILRQFLLETLLITGDRRRDRLRRLARQSAPSFPKFGATEFVGDPEISLLGRGADGARPRHHGPSRRLVPGAGRRRGSIRSWR